LKLLELESGKEDYSDCNKAFIFKMVKITMKSNEFIPTKNEVKAWLVHTLKHSCHVEYFLDKLNLGGDDPERPHDLVGPGNKYESEIISGFALQGRNPEVDFKTYIMPALNLHRQQYHHRMFNEPNPDDIASPAPEATREDMLFGAVDAACSLLENRSYQGGVHSYEEVDKILKNNPPHKVPWTNIVVPEMQKLKQPNLELITSLENIPNIGLPEQIYKKIIDRTNEVVSTWKI